MYTCVVYKEHILLLRQAYYLVIFYSWKGIVSLLGAQTHFILRAFRFFSIRKKTNLCNKPKYLWNFRPNLIQF